MDRRQFIGSAGLALLAATLPRVARAAATSGNPADQALAALLDRMWQRYLEESPETATALGLDKGANAALRSRLDDYSRASQDERLASNREWLKQLAGIDRAALSPRAQPDLDVVPYMYDQQTRGAQYP